MNDFRPPRFWRSIIQMMAEPRSRTEMLGDLREEFVLRAGADLKAARAWYRRQAVASIAPSMQSRWRARRRRISAFAFPGLFDLRSAARQLLRNPGVTAATVLSLTVGLTGVITVFTIVDSVWLKPLPYADPERLVSVWANYDDSAHPTQPLMSPLDLLDFRARSEAFESFSGAVGFSVPLSRRPGVLC